MWCDFKSVIWDLLGRHWSHQGRERGSLENNERTLFETKCTALSSNEQLVCCRHGAGRTKEEERIKMEFYQRYPFSSLQIATSLHNDQR